MPGLVQLQRARQALQAAARGFAADAGVDDLVPVPLSLKSLCEQRDPTLLWPDSVGGTQTVAEYEDGAVRGHRVLERNEQQSHAERPGAGDSQQCSQS